MRHTKQTGSKAFSLIELIVVITIIGLLAGAAFTAYKGYTSRAKISELVNVVNTYRDKSILYAQQNGRFPNAYDLGLAATPGEASVDDPSAIFPSEYSGSPTNLFGFYDDSVNIGFSSPCGAIMVMQLTVDAYNAGVPQVNAANQGVLSLLVYMYHINNAITALNMFYIYDGANYIDGDLTGGWINYFDPQLAGKFAELEAQSSCQ